ncbi:signal peptidase I [Candidatus Saccharibacteria bacterium]|nr:signal peptidase I [Candidatus Saccharibacteria bacterium]
MGPDNKIPSGDLLFGRIRSQWAGLSHRSKEVISTLSIIAAAVVLAFGLTKFVIQSYQVEGSSMETTLQNNDRLIVNKIPRTLARLGGQAYIPHRGDIIIFNQEGLNFGTNREKQLIKRVIGLPGERVVVKNEQVSVYNKDYPGGFDPDKSGLYRIASPTTPGNTDITLGSDEVFVSGDNRTNSEDSRYFGPVKAEKIVGKLALRVIPLSKAQRF